MTFKETDDIWRLYVREWVTVHTVTMTGVDARNAVLAADEWARDNLHGRVHDKDTDLASLFWVHVRVFKDNLKGEFKHRLAAENSARTRGYEEYTVVARNSKSDHAIRSYGVTKL
jgi:hypothetical protein